MRVQRIGAQHIGDIGEIFRPITCLLCHNSVPCYDLVDSQVRKTSNNNHCGILPVYKIYIIIYKGAEFTDSSRGSPQNFLRNFFEFFAKFLRNFYEIFAKFLLFTNFLQNYCKLFAKSCAKHFTQMFCKNFAKN